MKQFEMVCAGNSGRSPVAEIIGNVFLEEHGYDHEYRCVSSGTLVDQVKASNIPMRTRIAGIRKAIDRGDVYSESERIALSNYKDDLSDMPPNIADMYFRIAGKKFMEEEVACREETLKGMGLETMLKEGHDQTVVNPDAVAVFAMDLKNWEKVNEIYQPVADENRPLIVALKAYATRRPGAEIPNYFGNNKPEEYQRTAAEIAKYVPIALHRYISESQLSQSRLA